MYYTLDNFYKSKEWEHFRQIVINERLDERGFNICEYCNEHILKPYDLIAHHKIELTEDNVNDVEVSLNSDNIMLIHHKCHNIIHNKLQHSRRSVYIVYGSPLSGKREYVNSVRAEGDLIIDIERIWQCVSGGSSGGAVKSNRLRAVVFSVRDNLLECVKYRRGKWLNAYIIGGYPLISERERLAKELGAELIFIDTDKDECINRLMQSDKDLDEYLEYIEDWWSKFTPTVKN